MKGPQRYPGASTEYWYQNRYPGSSMESNVGVIHTTEGTSVPGYGGGSSAPNFTALPDIPAQRLHWFQHFDFDVSSRALVNAPGAVETNTLNAVQIELVGTCDPTYRHSWGSRWAGKDYLFWPDAPDWALAELGKFVRRAHQEHGIRLSSTVVWKAYPGSYGANGVRLTGPEWAAYYGWLGHSHVPENSHGDPGNLDFARVLEHATGQGEDMTLTKMDVATLWLTDGVVPVPEDWSPGNAEWMPASILIDIGKRIRGLDAKLGAQQAAITELAKALAAHDERIDADALVQRIRDAIESTTVRLDVPD